MKKPNFFIVGAPKCGTTAMYIYLKQHPQIFMSDFKEPHFFGTDLKPYYCIRDKKKYFAQFSAAKNEKRIGDASVWYLYSSRAALEIKEFDPKAKIIIMLRHPIEMIHSLYSMMLYMGEETILDFEDALTAEVDRKNGNRIPNKTNFIQQLFYQDCAKFAVQVKRYFDVFPRKQVHIIIFDDFETQTNRIYRQTCHFLEVDKEFQPKFHIVNAHRRIKHLRALHFLRKPPESLSVISNLIPEKLRKPFVRGLINLTIEGGPRPQMAPALRQKLQKEFEPDIKQLIDLLDKDLSSWLK